MLFLRKNQGYILTFAGILCIIYFAVCYSRGITFAGFFAIPGAFLIGAGILRISGKKKCYGPKITFMVKACKYVLIFMLIFFILIESAIIYIGGKKSTEKCDYIIILGAGLWGDQISYILYERLEAGIACIKNNPQAKVVLSGGRGPGETITEAEAMRRYLVENGVDEKTIIKEEKSASTFQNINNSKKIMDEMSNNKNYKVIIVTSNFHMLRSEFLADKSGLDAYGYASEIPVWLIPTYYTREYFAVVKALIDVL